MDVSHAPRCGTAIFNVSCADAGMFPASRTAAAAANRSETVFMTTTEIPLHAAERRDRTCIVKHNAGMGQRSLFGAPVSAQPQYV
jgi:hypothetical protein